ncbi:MAG: CRISPR-associated endonuclease Cas2 [Lachnospiraceae bacterium]|nr:CRISPR-associated endonuclease Cas2 [Lachnospiraceae bacterium]
MFVIVTYDINKKRVGKALKICRKYLIHVQKSVFEGAITESRLEKLKKEIGKLIDVEEDAVCIYRFESPKYAKKEQIGLVELKEHII